MSLAWVHAPLLSELDAGDHLAAFPKRLKPNIGLTRDLMLADRGPLQDQQTSLLACFASAEPDWGRAAHAALEQLLPGALLFNLLCDLK